jgi:hypothetical protein
MHAYMPAGQSETVPCAKRDLLGAKEAYYLAYGRPGNHKPVPHYTLYVSPIRSTSTIRCMSRLSNEGGGEERESERA